MRALILCPGPSLARLQAMPACDVSIGINRACLRWATDWWSALDYQTFVRDQPDIIGDPALLTREAYRPKYTGRRGLNVEQLRTLDVAGVDVFSATAALALAHTLGATQIDVYGADWTDDADFDGVRPAESRRCVERWAHERNVWATLVDRLDAIGVTVARH